MSFADALRLFDALLAVAAVLAYTWVMTNKERHGTYAGPAQFVRYLALWTLLVSVTTGLIKGIREDRPLSYVTWMLTAAIIINVGAAFLDVRDVRRGVRQYNGQ